MLSASVVPGRESIIDPRKPSRSRNQWSISSPTIVAVEMSCSPVLTRTIVACTAPSSHQVPALACRWVAMGPMRRFRRATLVVCAGILLGISVYAGLVKLGLARSPFRPVAGGNLELARSGRSGVRVLFVGNSLTFKNDLPELVHRLGGARTPIFAGS